MYFSALYFRCILLFHPSRISVPKWIKSIPTHAISHAPYLEELHFLGTVKEIHKDAIVDCPSLKNIYFHADVNTIAPKAFSVSDKAMFHFNKSIQSDKKEKMINALNVEVNASKHSNSGKSFQANGDSNIGNSLSAQYDAESEPLATEESEAFCNSDKLSEVEEVSAAEENHQLDDSIIPETSDSELPQVAEEVSEETTSTEGDNHPEKVAVPEILDPEQPQLAEEASEKISIAEEDTHPEEAPVSQIPDPEQPQLAEETSEETTIAVEDDHPEEEAVSEITDPEQPQLFEETSEGTSIAEEDNHTEEDVPEITDLEQPQLAEKTSEETSIAEEENHSEEEGGAELPDSELPQEAEERSTETSAVEENIQNEESAASAAPIAELSHEVSTEVLDKLLVNTASEVTNPEPVIEQYDVLSKTEKSKRLSKTERIGRTRKSEPVSKESLRDRDLKKYASPASVTTIKTTDPLASVLIERYRIQQNKYGSDFPLSLIDISKEEYTQLADQIRKWISAESDVTLLKSFLCSVFLVKTAENYDVKGTFWDTVSAVLQCKEPSLETVMKKALLFFCSSEQMYFHYYNGGHAYAGTIMIHTVIGAGDLDDTMSFLKRFYIEELHESFTPSDVPKSIQLLITELAKDFDSDEVVKGKLNGLYQIGFQFKCACRCFPDAMAEIIFCLLYNLDAYHHNTSNISYTPAVFYKYFKRWKISDILHERSQKKSPAAKRTVVSAKKEKQIERVIAEGKCSYLLEESMALSLFIPAINLSAEQAESRVTLHLYHGGQELTQYQRECEILGVFKFYADKLVIPLEQFYQDLRVKIISDEDKILFDTKTQLFRRQLFFDEELIEIRPKKIPASRFYVLTQNTDEFLADADYHSYPCSNYIVHSLDVGPECEITVGGQLLFFHNDLEDGVEMELSSTYRVRSTYAYMDETEYQVYTQAPVLLMRIAPEQAETYILDVGSQHIDLSHFAGEETYEINTQDLSNGAFLSVILRKKGETRHLREWHIAVLKQFQYTLDRDFYYQEKSVELLDLYAEAIDFDVEEYPALYPITQTGKITVNAAQGDTNFYLEIRLPLLCWQIGEQYSSFSRSRYIPVSAIQEERFCRIRIPFHDAKLFAVNETINRQLVPVNGKIDMTDFRISNAESTSFGVTRGTNVQISLFELLYTSALREISVVCNEDILRVSCLRFGECTIRLIIQKPNGKTVMSKDYPDDGETETVITEKLADLPDGQYILQLYKTETDPFGFASKSVLVGNYPFSKGNPLELYLHTHENLLSPECCYFDEKTRKPVYQFYCENLVRSASGSEIFTANAYFLTNSDRKTYFKQANPVHIELLRRTEKQLLFTITDKDGDGFLYEKNTGHLISDSRGLRDYHAYMLPDHYVVYL